MHEEKPQMPTDTFQVELVADSKERVMGNSIITPFLETSVVTSYFVFSLSLFLSHIPYTNTHTHPAA